MRTTTNAVGLVALLMGWSLAASVAMSRAEAGGNRPVKVFVLADQSNMEGKA